MKVCNDMVRAEKSLKEVFVFPRSAATVFCVRKIFAGLVFQKVAENDGYKSF